MLDSRNYMRRPEEPDPAAGMRCMFILIAVNAVVFLLFGNMRSLCLSPAEFMDGAYYQIATAMFMHDGFMHLFFNMFSLYIFGQLAAPRLGAKQFLFLFLFAGIAGNLAWLASVSASPLPQVLLGASGAVMGVIIATAMMFPDIEMLLLFVPFPLKLRTMALVFIAIELFSQFSSGAQSGVAYIAHIGGFSGGYLYMILFLKKYIQWDPVDFLFGKKQKRPDPAGWTVYGEEVPRRENPAGSAPTGRVTQKELDYLLDKISREGINALSETEMERLRQAREQMRSQPN